MKIFGFHITRHDPAATRRVVEPRPRMADYSRLALASSGLRPGMWVMREGEWPRAGILTGLNADNIASVMLTQEDGTNLASTHVPRSSIRQAYYDEIPLARQNFPAGQGGYGRKP